MQGHFRYLRFKTFPMTLRTPQCKVFWALLLISKHSGVLEDSKSPTLQVLGFTPTLGQSGVATIPFCTHSKSIYNQLLANYIHLILMPKVDICPLDQECVQKFQHYIKHRCFPQKQRKKPCFRSLVFFRNNILPILHPLYMFVIVLFHLCPHELLKV
jgi:hypothetical protein